MNRFLVYLFVVHVCVVDAHVYQLTHDTLNAISHIQDEDAEGSLDMINHELQEYQSKLESYLHKGDDINVRGALGQTALMLAAQEANSVIVSLLLQHHADVEGADDEGLTPLMHFVSYWIIVENEVYCIRSNPVARTYQSPEQCMQLLLSAGSESLELALLHVEHIRARRSETVQIMHYEGFKRALAQIALKLNPKSLLEKTKRRIKMRRLRHA